MNPRDELRKAFFNERAAGWLDAHYKRPGTGRFDRYSDRIQNIVSSLDLEPESRVLDVGCGSGVLVPYLLEPLGAGGRLFEMDYAGEMIRENQKQHQDQRITFVHSDVTVMAFDADSLDAIICFACFPHFEHPRKALERMAVSLSPGGRLTIAHLMSSQELAAHHDSHTPVSRDRLPAEAVMKHHVRKAGFTITAFKDQSGLYLLCAVKSG